MSTRAVPGSTDILPRDLPESVGQHRIDYWTWVEKNADTATRDRLVVLRDHWRECNTKFFNAIMLEPYVTLTEPSAPQIYGQCWPVSSWGSRLEIRIRPSLLGGTHPQIVIPYLPDPDHADSVIADWRGYEAGRTQFVKDVLLHEMIHQHIMEHQRGVDESAYHGHGPVFTAHCNRIGAELGLAPVVVRNRGDKKPKAAQWPHCVAEPDRYHGVYQPHQKRVTATGVTIPVGYRASSVAPLGQGDRLEIGFDPASGDGPSMYVAMDVDAADELARLIADHLDPEPDL